MPSSPRLRWQQRWPSRLRVSHGAGKMSFKEAMSLRVGGMDRYSRVHLQELVAAVGAAGVALTRAAFPGKASGGDQIA